MTEFNLSFLHPASWTGGLFARPAGLSTAPGRTVERLLAWQDRAMQRRKLAEMDYAMLADIGISRVDALAEADKPFWRD